MITSINKNILASMYRMSLSTFDLYIQPHRLKIKKIGTKRRNDKGGLSYAQNYNSKQLKLIIKILGDTPEGYDFNGKTFIKVET